ncbi:MAG: patatin-like phospholipase family protein [Calditrichaeota bacterium]|nr:patatin-like phospholipase family protein [Candidatus Cloacimonadota bacterium]MCA9787210.1 patatin-like phospholipase family protein [Candidatus Cloacimonadota bacterium]MCB1048226.1 patatin-like phospholipase family protein [Calditrichota bacterium]MCB9474295.1 patatin-like phospholipase family protein [Candidatus Delongbacteria bacterium]
MIQRVSALLILLLALGIQAAERPRLALALGGGAALGYAHLGVLAVLEEEGIVPDLVTGASMGSIVGGYWCAGMPLDSIRMEASELNLFKLLDWKLGKRGFFEWKKVRRRLDRRLGGLEIQNLPVPLIAVATDLYTGDRVMLDHGNLIDAMLASATIPGLYQPVTIAGRELVDGGLVDEVPILSARDAGALIVVAVDVSHPLLPADIGSPFDVMRQAYFIIQMHNVAARATQADVLIRPELEGLDFQDFGQVQEAEAAGRKAALEALPRIRELLANTAFPAVSVPDAADSGSAESFPVKEDAP